MNCVEQIEQDIEKAKGEVTASVSGLEKARKNLQKVIDEKARLEVCKACFFPSHSSWSISECPI